MPTATLPRRALLIGSLCVLLAAAAGAAIQGQPGAHPAQPTRLAIVNLGKVMDGLDEGKDAKARLEQQATDSKKKLEDINAQLKKIDSDLELKKEQKDTPEYRTLAGQRLVLTAQGRALQEVLQQLMDEQEGTTVRTVYVKMADAVAAIAKRDGWDLVLRDDRDLVPPPATRDGRPLTGREVRAVIDQRSILAASDAIDISQSVMTQMNNDYKAGKGKK